MGCMCDVGQKMMKEMGMMIDALEAMRMMRKEERLRGVVFTIISESKASKRRREKNEA